MADTTGTTTDTTGAGTDIWSTVANNFGDYLTGGANLLNAINGKPSYTLAPGSTVPATQALPPKAPATGIAALTSNPLYIIVIILILCAVFYMMFKK